MPMRAGRPEVRALCRAPPALRLCTLGESARGRRAQPPQQARWRGRSCAALIEAEHASGATGPRSWRWTNPRPQGRARRRRVSARPRAASGSRQTRRSHASRRRRGAFKRVIQLDATAESTWLATKSAKHRHHETAALHLRGEQHQRQRYERDDPGVVSSRASPSRPGAAEVTADVAGSPIGNDPEVLKMKVQSVSVLREASMKKVFFAGVGQRYDVRFDFVRDQQRQPQRDLRFFLADENLSAAVRRRQRPEAASMTHVKPLRETCSV